jgi:hypothetical protein
MVNKATVHLFSARKIGYDVQRYNELFSIESIERTYPGFTAMMKRGDIIENVDESDYRSSTIYFFDGTNIITKDTSTTDDYGSPPIEFELITEFSPGYWNCSYDCSYSECYVNNRFEPNHKSDFYWHSEYAWSPINLEKLGIQGKELEEYMGGYYYCTFIHNGKEYVLTHNNPKLPENGVLYVYCDESSDPLWPDAVCISTIL